MSSEKGLFTAFQAYMDAYFRERNLEKTLGMFHPSMTCVGTGQDEMGLDSKSTKDLYRRDLEQAENPIDVEYLKTKVVPLTPDTGLVVSEFNISGNIMEQPFIMNGLRLTIIFTKVDSQWKPAHKHISLPTDVHETGEAYPLKEIEERNRLLEAMVDEKT